MTSTHREPVAGAASAGAASPATSATSATSAALATTLALAACGGGGDAPAPEADPAARRPGTAPGGSAPGDSAPTPSLTLEEEAARFLAQAGLGPTLAEVRALAATPRNGRVDTRAWLDAQFAMPARTATAASLQDRTAFQLGLDLGLLTDPDPVRDPFNSGYGMDNVLWFRLLTAQDVLRQRVVLALSEIFVVSQRTMPIPWGQFAILAYWDLLERHCFGTFRQLVEAVTLSPAMGTYLSLRGSQKADASGRRPDENFARELLQLFTIGLVRLDDAAQPGVEETYTSADVSELARALTGWDFDMGADTLRFEPSLSPSYTARPMVASTDWHDSDSKTFLGLTLPAGGSAADDLRLALDRICDHPNVAPFIVRQLIQRLVTSNPEPEHIRRAAAVFVSTKGDLKAVIRAVLTDPLARDVLSGNAAVRRCKLREPILRFIQWGRVAGLRSSDGRWEVGDLSDSNRLGQSPLRAPSVFNFFRPGYVPLNSGLSADGFVAPEFQITNESTVIGYVNFMLRNIDGAAPQNMVVDYTDWLPMASDATRLVDQLNLVLTGRALAATTVDIIRTAVQSLPAASDLQRRQRVLAAFFLMLSSPDHLVQR